MSKDLLREKDVNFAYMKSGLGTDSLGRPRLFFGPTKAESTEDREKHLKLIADVEAEVLQQLINAPIGKKLKRKLSYRLGFRTSIFEG